MKITDSLTNRFGLCIFSKILKYISCFLKFLILSRTDHFAARSSEIRMKRESKAAENINIFIAFVRDAGIKIFATVDWESLLV